nr:hypothetical protein [Clostridia bacterium]
MKKLLFILTFLLTTLLMTSVALAARCDSCGSSNVSKIGSGAWCHWDCNECGSRTSRNHNPNSYNCGLVPASCSGRCSWCGASAVWSSHSFTNWVPAGDATCTKDGTENAKCSNAQCKAKTSRNAPGSALGHSYSDTVVAPTCEGQGYTRHTCTRCSHSYDDAIKSPLSHTYGAWVHNEDGTHTSACTRQRCYNSITAPCSSATVVVGGKTVTLCPVCGYITAGDVIVDLDTSTNASAESLDGQKLPGRLMVLVDAAPLDIPLKTDAFYMFITSFQFSGKSVEFTGKVKITIDLNKHPFSMPDSIFFEMPPADLKARAFKIVRVEQEDIDGQLTEVWNEMPFTLKNGILTFETDKMGTFLMVLNIMEAPVG